MINFNYSEFRVYVLVGGHRGNIKTNTETFVVIYPSAHLILFMMVVSIEGESDNMLVPFSKRLVSILPFMETSSRISMRNNNGLTFTFF